MSTTQPPRPTRGRRVRVGLHSTDPRVEVPSLTDGTELDALIGEAYRLSRRRMEQVVRAHGITRAQFGLLMSLAERPGLSGIEVAARAFITPQAAHAALTTLQRKGLIEREAETAHRRMVRAELTDEGARVVTACLDDLRALGSELGARLSRDERRALIRLLREYVEVNLP